MFLTMTLCVGTGLVLFAGLVMAAVEPEPFSLGFNLIGPLIFATLAGSVAGLAGGAFASAYLAPPIRHLPVALGGAGGLLAGGLIAGIGAGVLFTPGAADELGAAIAVSVVAGCAGAGAALAARAPGAEVVPAEPPPPALAAWGLGLAALALAIGAPVVGLSLALAAAAAALGASAIRGSAEPAARRVAMVALAVGATALVANLATAAYRIAQDGAGLQAWCAACTGDGGPDAPTQPEPGPAVADVPGAILGLRDGRVVEINLSSGAETAELYDPGTGPAPAFLVSPRDSDIVVLSRMLAACTSQGIGISPDGRGPVQIIHTTQGVIESADYSRDLGLFGFVRRDCEGGPSEAVVGGPSGRETLLGPGGSVALVPGLPAVAVARDGIVEVTRLGTAGEIAGSYALRPAEGCSLSRPVFPDNPAHFVAVRMCGADPATQSLVWVSAGDPAESGEQSPSVLLDLPEGRVVGSSLSFDGPGRNLLYSTAPSGGGAELLFSLAVFEESASPERLYKVPDGVANAVW